VIETANNSVRGALRPSESRCIVAGSSFIVMTLRTFFHVNQFRRPLINRQQQSWLLVFQEPQGSSPTNRGESEQTRRC
jgi:hypothetical protein